MLVSDLINSSLRTIGVIQKSETISSADMTNCLQALNMMLGHWSAQSLMVRGYITQSFPLIAMKPSYTIGNSSTLDFNSTYGKPVDIRQMWVTDTNLIQTNLDIVSMDQMNSYEDQYVSYARPTNGAYDPGQSQFSTVEFGTIWVYPMPDASTGYTLYFVTQCELTQFTSSSVTVNFEEPYFEALKYNLAKRLWLEYKPDKPINQLLFDMAKTTKHRIMVISYQPLTAKIDVPGKRGAFNIFTGESK